MNAWILIMVISGLTDGGGGVGSVKFKTQKGCLEALAKLPSQNDVFASYGRKSLFAFCVEDK
jgi:hypothetical protein